MTKIKLSIIYIAIISIFILSGCGEKIKNEYGENVNVIGPYIEISREPGKDAFGSELDFITAYEKNTKIVHRITIGSHRYSDIYLFSYDKNGRPILQFYEEGKIITK